MRIVTQFKDGRLAPGYAYEISDSKISRNGDSDAESVERLACAGLWRERSS
jgi:hypothetical protein